jgi:hypothetical protein
MRSFKLLYPSRHLDGLTVAEMYIFIQTQRPGFERMMTSIQESDDRHSRER